MKWAFPQSLGHLESKTGDAEEARSLFKRATSADPKHAYSWQVHASRNAALQAHSQDCGPLAYSGNRHTRASLASGCKHIVPGFVRWRGSQPVHRTPSTRSSLRGVCGPGVGRDGGAAGQHRSRSPGVRAGRSQGPAAPAAAVRLGAHGGQLRHALPQPQTHSHTKDAGLTNASLASGAASALLACACCIDDCCRHLPLAAAPQNPASTVVDSARGVTMCPQTPPGGIALCACRLQKRPASASTAVGGAACC